MGNNTVPLDTRQGRATVIKGMRMLGDEVHLELGYGMNIGHDNNFLTKYIEVDRYIMYDSKWGICGDKKEVNQRLVGICGRAVTETVFEPHPAAFIKPAFHAPRLEQVKNESKSRPGDAKNWITAGVSSA